MDELLSALNENIYKEDCQIRMGVIFIIIALILCSLTDVMGSQSWEKVMIQNADGFQKAPIIGKAACSIGTRPRDTDHTARRSAPQRVRMRRHALQ